MIKHLKVISERLKAYNIKNLDMRRPKDLCKLYERIERLPDADAKISTDKMHGILLVVRECQVSLKPILEEYLEYQRNYIMALFQDSVIKLETLDTLLTLAVDDLGEIKTTSKIIPSRILPLGDLYNAIWSRARTEAIRKLEEEGKA